MSEASHPGLDGVFPGLDGKVVIVTGGTGSQGAIEAQLLARSGARVVIADLFPDKGEELVENIRSTGVDALFLKLDVTDAAGWKSLVGAAIDKWGGIDALVNNAGISDRARLEGVTMQAFTKVMNVNVFGAMLGINAVTAPMTKKGSGSIVNISSVSGSTAWPSAVYTMSKWAVTGLTKIAALELGPLGIRVNSVHPGPIANEMTAFQSDGFRTGWATATPLERMGHPHEIASIVAFLCSEGSSFMSGAELAADGGFLAAGGVKSVFAADRRENP